MFKVYAPRNVPAPDLRVAGMPEQIQHGEYLANSFCTTCHSVNGELPLTGGMDLGEDFPLPLGKFVSVNLTPAGPLQDWSDGEIFRAMRSGVDPNGHHIIDTMPWKQIGRLDDVDLTGMYHYLISLP